MRNESQLPPSAQKTFPFLIAPKASKSEKNRGCEELYWRKTKQGCIQIDREQWEELGKEEERIYKEAGKRVSLRAWANIHPSVKSTKLMSYLIILGSREGDTVVDPFMGTGTVGIACQLLKREFIGYELDEGYFEIATARLAADRQVML